MTASLTAAVYTHNSAGDLLRAVLDGVRWADEIIVVDMDSTDDTLAICSEYTKRIFQHNESENINRNFNFGYRQASTDFILHISHDFVVSSELRDEIRSVLEDPHPADVYRIPMTTFFFGEPVQLSVWEKDLYPLLFRPGSVEYPTERIESMPQVRSSNVSRLHNRIEHYTVASVSMLARKYNRYSDIEVRNSPQVFKVHRHPWAIAFSSIGYWLYNYLWRGGWRYGMVGFIVTFEQGHYRFLQLSKRWERDHRQRQGLPWHEELQE